MRLRQYLRLRPERGRSHRSTSQLGVLLLLLLFAVLAAPGMVAAGEVSDLAAHRALYKLTMQSARGDINAARGTMSYEILDACEGWTSRQRLAMTLTNREGQDIEMLSDYSTFESKDGLRLQFRMRQTTDGSVTSEVAGDAKLDRAGGPGEVNYTVPEVSTKKLPVGTLFPMAHTAAILAAAKSGKKFLALPLFDGTGVEGAQDSSIAIAGWDKPQPNNWPDLAKLPSSRVHVAFFDRHSNAQQPDYEVGMRYWENGVADDLSMDFGDFVMTGKLTDLVVPPAGC